MLETGPNKKRCMYVKIGTGVTNAIALMIASAF